jgi:hypothetical protein
MKDPIEEIAWDRHLRPEATQGRTMYEGHVLVDLAAVVDECRSLRLALHQPSGIEPFVERIRAIRVAIEQSHDRLDAEAHLARMVVVAQMQVLDTVLQNARLFTPETP